MAEGSSPSDRYAEFARLGGGGVEDRLRFRLILRILLRCLPLIVHERRHLLALLGASLVLWLLITMLALQFIDVFWSGVLKAEPLTSWQSQLLLLDPEVVTGPEPLAKDVRKMVIRRLVSLGIPAFLVLTPLGLALWSYYPMWILQRINQTLRLWLHDRFQALSLRFHAESRVGDAVYRMYQDSAMVTQVIDVLFIDPVRVFGFLVAALVLVAGFSGPLALVLLGSIPLLALLGALMSQPMRVGFRAAREANSTLTSRIQETLAGIRVIKAYGAEAVEQTLFERDSLSAFGAAFAARNRYAVFKVLGFFCIGTALLIATAVGAWLTVREAELFWTTMESTWLWGLLGGLISVRVWRLGAWNNLKDRFGDGTNALRRLMALWGRVQDVAIGLDRVFEVLDLEPEVEDAPDAVPMPRFEESIAFRDVSFRYQADRPTLEHVDFEATAGSITAVVGPTGSGKSTLMALLLRLFDPDEGRIEIDGRDIRDFALASLRANIAIALQENVLFGTTVRENIRYAVPSASDEMVREAARVACADGFIEHLAEGYDTLLGERGTKLSTGQRQRLSIARAILKDAPILILDEPTASLDAQTELGVLRNLAEWGAGRAIFLITHRLSTIRRADQVVVLREGRLAEWGSHADLMTRAGGAYRGLVEAEDGAARVAALGAS